MRKVPTRELIIVHNWHFPWLWCLHSDNFNIYEVNDYSWNKAVLQKNFQYDSFGRTQLHFIPGTKSRQNWKLAIKRGFLVKHRSKLTETKFSFPSVPMALGFFLFLFLLRKICFNKPSIIRSYRKNLVVKRNLWAEVLLLTFFHCKWEDRKCGIHEKNLQYQKIRTLPWDKKKKVHLKELWQEIEAYCMWCVPSRKNKAVFIK